MQNEVSCVEALFFMSSVFLPSRDVYLVDRVSVTCVQTPVCVCVCVCVCVD
jgi:hypothetical protein